MLSTATQIPLPQKTFQADALAVRVYANKEELSAAAAQEVNAYLCGLLEKQDSVAAILATGNSQIEFLKSLIAFKQVDWSKVILFHMDEYLGISGTHKASFRRYMKEKVESLVHPKAFHYIEGDAALPLDECRRYSTLLSAQSIDLCCLGIGENGHLAFNDPPVANFEDTALIKLVKLDDECKMQQVREGHFPDLASVNPYAYTLTIPALCSAKKMVCISPEKRKASAVKGVIEGPISTACPASFLRKQSHATLLLDSDSTSLLS